MIGQNNCNGKKQNTDREIVEGVVEIVTYLRIKLFNVKILLLGIFARGKFPSPERDKLFSVNKELARRYVDNKQVFFMDINPFLMNDDGTLKEELFLDYEHPSEAGYVVWADAIENKVAELMGDSPKPPMTD